MTDGLFSATELTEANALPGFRLSRLEVLNWGTFDQRAWRFELGQRNALLTGDIGSGKSTLVDAITTLLVRADRIAYNKAAGAENRERDLRSYVRGHHKTMRDEVRGTSRPVALRAGSTYSVILGVFAHQELARQVTLAQVFWMSADQETQPSRFFVTGERDMTIAEDFSGFGPQIPALKRRLRAQPGVTVSDAFGDYGRTYRRLLGVPGEQAIELFHQTISMKSVGDLNEFVREHMLEPFDVAERIEKVVAHVDDLTRSHEAVLKAKRQLASLQPIIADGDEHDCLVAEVDRLRIVRSAIPGYFAQLTRRLLDDRRAQLTVELDAATVRAGELADEVRAGESRRDDLITERAHSGGDRLTRIADDITAASTARDRAQVRDEQHRDALTSIGLQPVIDADSFAARLTQVAAVDEQAQIDAASLQDELTDVTTTSRAAEEQARELNSELLGLKNRGNSIPERDVQLRRRLCEGIGADPADLPFVGELIGVREDSRDWEGAAERLLRGFAISLVVPQRWYGEVSAWVNAHHLRSRLTYYRVDTRTSSRTLPDPGRLFDVLEVRPGEHADWLTSELAHRTDLMLADSLDDFRGAARAITREGQIKTGGGRHDKDDRFDVRDTSRYVMGWDNARKVDALLDQARLLSTRLDELKRQRVEVDNRLKAVQAVRLTVAGLIVDFADIDWRGHARRIADLDQERAEIEASSDDLARIAKALDETESRLARSKLAAQESAGVTAVVRSRLDDVVARIERADRDVAVELDEEAFGSAGGEALLAEHLPTSLDDADRAQTRATKSVGERMEKQLQAQGVVDRRLQHAMSEFRREHPADTRDVDDSPDGLNEYRSLHERIAGDDLPRFEREFRELLTTNTIREIVGFQADLNKQEELIKARVDTINDSLRGIDYNPGRYIELTHHASPNADIRDFRADLRACSSGVVGQGGEAYSEAKFLEVKRLIDRFKGREGLTEIDRRWTRNVTDVRNWLVFSASERWHESGEEFEHYSDSGGKSGGQKEKLAYTILAASLAYQFGIEWGRQRSHTLQFVVIDEAFGRGSDESARFALKLFQTLGLQLLVVTPMQKIHIIEPFVSTVGVVDNPDGAGSRLQVLTIDEYRRDKRAREAVRLDDEESS